MTKWLLTALATLAWAGGSALAQTQGVYVDAQGARHAWQVAPNHALLWEDKPFVPVGGLFQARSWTPKPTDADFAEDETALQRLRDAGVTDVYLQPASGGITDVPAAAIQRLIDRLEKDGFTYGLSLNDGPHVPLIGYQVLPSRFRQAVTPAGGTLRFPTTELASALYCVALTSNSDILEMGDATVVSEGARVVVPPVPGAAMVLVYPERIFFPRTGLGLPNLWQGLESYRDSLLNLFGRVKLGKGFRFFVDPLPSHLEIGAEVRQIVPTSPAFAGEWAEFLKRKYGTIGTLEQAWRLSQRDSVQTFDEAADLVPLWFGDKGLPAFYRKANAKRLSVEFAGTNPSAFWADLDAFKLETVRNAMNELAVALKRGVADVPVVYRSRGYSTLFTRIPATGGFDGIGIDAYGRGPEAVQYGGAEVFAQATDAPKHLWLPVIATQERRIPDSNLTGFPSQQALFSILDSLREIGARGFYVDGVHLTDPTRKPYDLSVLPSQLQWLAEYASLLATAGIGTAASPQENAIFYPRQLASLAPIVPRSLGGGRWWLPTDRVTSPGFVQHHFGPAGQAYAMNDSGGTVYYLWRPEGERQIHLKLPRPARGVTPPVPYWLPADRAVRTKDLITITVGPEPVRLFNLPGLPIPLEAFPEMLNESRQIVAEIKRRRTGAAPEDEITLERLRAQFDPTNPEAALAVLDEMRVILERLRTRVVPYAWIEAESLTGTAHSFDQIDDRPGASGSRVLLVRDRPASFGPPTATFRIEVGVEAPYRLWIAADPAAAFSLRIDGQVWGGDDATRPRPVGAVFGSAPLVWFDCGPMPLTPGIRKLDLRAEGPMALDVVLLTRSAFTPNGTNHPPVLP